MRKHGMLVIVMGIYWISTFANASQLYRFSEEKMKILANDKVFPNRIFYNKKSEGPHAKWFDAVKTGNYNEVKNLIELGQDIDVKDEAELGQTALGWAAFIGYKDIVELLIKKGASLKATDRADVKHVFKSAIMGGDLEIIEYIYSLSKDFIDINELEDDGETMLIVASYGGRLDSVRFLIDKGARIDVFSEGKQQNALTYACTLGHQDVIDFLIKQGALNYKTGLASC